MKAKLLLISLIILIFSISSWSLYPPSKDSLQKLPYNDKLKHLWSFNDNLIDNIGGYQGKMKNVKDLQFNMSGVLYTDGILDRAIYLNGENDRVDLPPLN